MELGDDKVEVMGWNVYVDKLLRITGKVTEEILAPLASNVIRESDPIDKRTFCRKSGEDNIIHVLVSANTRSAMYWCGRAWRQGYFSPFWRSAKPSLWLKPCLAQLTSPMPVAARQSIPFLFAWSTACKVESQVFFWGQFKWDKKRGCIGWLPHYSLEQSWWSCCRCHFEPHARPSERDLSWMPLSLHLRWKFTSTAKASW